MTLKNYTVSKLDKVIYLVQRTQKHNMYDGQISTLSMSRDVNFTS